jgi:hypothetical protein
VTQEWLDEITAADETIDKHDGIQHLMARLETTLESFSKNANATQRDGRLYPTSWNSMWPSWIRFGNGANPFQPSRFGEGDA